jgi:hypothetical protein
MSSKPLPPDNHIARWVKPTLILRDDGGNPIGIYPDAFGIRPEDENVMSVSWVEYWHGTRSNQLRQVAENPGLTIRASHAYAILQVGECADICATYGDGVRILHEPEISNASHSGVHRYPLNNAALFAALAARSSKDFHIVRDMLAGKAG